MNTSKMSKQEHDFIQFIQQSLNCANKFTDGYVLNRACSCGIVGKLRGLQEFLSLSCSIVVLCTADETMIDCL